MPGETECRFECVLNLTRPKTFNLVVDRPDLWMSPMLDGAGQTDAAETGIEPFAGGPCYLITAEGQRIIWGTVLSIEEPMYVRLAWQIGPDGLAVADPGASSRVMINFRDAGEYTRLEIVHGEFLRHGEQGEAYCEKMRGTGGWPQLVTNLQDAAHTFSGK